MIIENRRGAEVHTLGDAETIDMSIDLTDKRFIMDLFSEGIYSDSVGSLIRETVSNSLDANRESGSSNPVIVSLQSDHNGQYWFKSTDCGPGISEDRMESVISKYFSSTKRNSNNYIGAMGLGLKSPISYSDSFNILTVHEGVEYKYIMYKSEEGTAIDLVYKTNTTAPNGTTIEVPVKGNDVNKFTEKIEEQLCYMEGVYFEVYGISNDFKIEKAEHWKYSSLNSNKYLHLSLDNVYYEMDFGKLGIKPIEIPIALRFELADGIVPIPSRESIKYTMEAKAKIMDKIRLAANDIIQRYNDSKVEVENIFDIWKELQHDKNTLELESCSFYINDFRHLGDIKIKPLNVKGIHNLQLNSSYCFNSENLKMFYVHGKIQHGCYQTKLKDANSFLYQTLRGDLRYSHSEYNGWEYIHVNEEPDRMKIKYLASLGKKYVLISRAHKNRPLYGPNGYVDFLELRWKSKKIWRTLIKEQRILEDGVLNNIIQLSSIIVPPEFIKRNTKERVVTVVEKQEINPKWVYKLDDRAGSRFYSFKNTGPEDVELFNEGLIVYCKEDKRELLTQLSCLLHYAIAKYDVKTCLMVDRDIKKISGKENWIHIDEFMSGHPLYIKYMTVLYIRESLYKSKVTEDNMKHIIKYMSPSIYSIYEELHEQKDKIDFTVHHYVDLTLIRELLAENTKWDFNLYDKMQYLKSIAESFLFFKHIADQSSINKEHFSFVIDVYKTKYPELFKQINI